ncbi:glycosyltransferase [Carboxydochorda subterranea]|uniref:Glycosyltransferase n=1 Tax=Carboxydichorda subterranea TaxID=3109565 RepID=A0ABZ1BX26_9FIRM|nr:glycosyltransferase [Limnochorda sp. L945t]WRP16687.1 glycosyltransferase [Limnochorda sp. L945t]
MDSAPVDPGDRIQRTLARIRVALPGRPSTLWRRRLATLRRLSARYRLRPAPVWRHVEPLDVLVLAATYGNGHLQAGRAVMQALVALRPELRTGMLDFFDLINPVFNAATRFAYIYSVRRAPTLWREFYERTARIRPESFLQQRLFRLGSDKVKRLIVQSGARVVLSTHPTPGGVVAQLAADGELPFPVLSATVITDYVLHSQWVHPATGLYLAPCEEVARELIARGIDASRVVVTGIPIRPAFASPPGREDARRRWHLEDDRPTVLILTGAYGMMRGAVEACRYVADLPRPLRLLVVAGRDRQLARTLRAELRGARNPVRILGYVDRIVELMVASDLVVTKAGGLTVSEGLALGVPMVIYAPIPGQEEGNAAFLRRHRAGEIALDPADLAGVVSTLLERPDRRAAMAAAAAALGRPLAAQAAAKLLLERAGL